MPVQKNFVFDRDVVLRHTSDSSASRGLTHNIAHLEEGAVWKYVSLLACLPAWECWCLLG